MARCKRVARVELALCTSRDIVMHASTVSARTHFVLAPILGLLRNTMDGTAGSAGTASDGRIQGLSEGG